jgi:quercetin dioxygenase-like cupin family protein
MFISSFFSSFPFLTSFAVVVKSKPMCQLETIRQALPEGTPAIEESGMPKGGKMFEEDNFSSGMLILPPGATKFTEVASSTEVFFVVAGARNTLEICIHNTTWLLSRGDNFFVPRGNVYLLKNRSDTESIKLYFTLVK